MSELLHVGIDVGSTTVKIVVLDEALNLIYSNYERHFSHQDLNLEPIDYESIALTN